MDEMGTVRKHILKKLYAYGAFHRGHLLEERLIRGVPGHLRGVAKDCLVQLGKEGLVRKYGITKYGDAYQLDINRLHEIEYEIFGRQ
jgi:hypothetical protein